MEYFKHVYTYNNKREYKQAGITLLETAIIENTVDKEKLLRNIFENKSGKAIASLTVHINLANEGSMDYTYNAISQKGNKFGNNCPIHIPYRSKVAFVSIEEIVYVDGQIINIQQMLAKEFTKELIDYPRDFLVTLKKDVADYYYYSENKQYWQCVCGHVNPIGHICERCHSHKEDIDLKFSHQNIKQHYITYLEHQLHHKQAQYDSLNKQYKDLQQEYETKQKPRGFLERHPVFDKLVMLIILSGISYFVVKIISGMW